MLQRQQQLQAAQQQAAAMRAQLQAARLQGPAALAKLQAALRQAPAPAVNVAPPKPLPPPPQATPEERAGGKFTLAMLWADNGNFDKAEEYCNLIVKTYPGTPAAGQAQAFLAQHAEN
jgi:hypothetical protein